MKLYRVDKRDFNVGDSIVTAGEFAKLNPEGSQRVEDSFEKERPANKPIRSKCLFLFENLTIAKKHWSKMTDGKLYEVEIDQSKILHQADMQLVDKAFKTTTDSDLIICAKDYWQGNETESPRIEVLVNDATVSAIVSKDQDERREYFKSWALA